MVFSDQDNLGQGFEALRGIRYRMASGKAILGQF